jgi:hypothetical protein
VAVFRFSPGEAFDPIDARSFSVALDGADRTPFYHVSADEAWGALGDDERPITAGVHTVDARICSMRGVCAVASTTIIVAPATPVVTDSVEHARPRSTRRRLLEALLSAARKLLDP